MEEDVKYSRELVQAVLLRALETGIKSETICAKMRPLFKKHDVTDEELIKGVGDAITEETERINKLTLSSRKQAAKVNSCMYDKDGLESKATKNVQSGEKGRRDTFVLLAAFFDFNRHFRNNNDECQSTFNSFEI